MKSWFKPLFVYRKYVLAEKILKNLCGTYGVLSNEPHEKPLLTERQYPNTYVAANFLNISYSTDSTRVIAAIDLLEDNQHITSNRNSNLYEFSIKCTKEGERAFHEGFYKKKIFNFWFKVAGIPTGIFGIIKIVQAIL